MFISKSGPGDLVGGEVRTNHPNHPSYGPEYVVLAYTAHVLKVKRNIQIAYDDVTKDGQSLRLVLGVQWT